MTDSEHLDTETTGTAQVTAPADRIETGTTDTETAETATIKTEETTMPQTSEATTATSQTDAAEELVDIETLGKDLPAWKLAGVMRHQRWASGKAVTETDFRAALAAFEGRPLGGGR